MSNWLSPSFNSRRIAAFLLLGLALWLIRSFVVPIVWATIFAVANWPLYRRTVRRCSVSLSAHILPLLFAALITLLVLGPVVFACGVLAEQAQDWLTEFAALDQRGIPAPSWMGDLPLVGRRLMEVWNSGAGVPGGLSAWFSRADAGSLMRRAQFVGQFVAYHAFVAAFTVIVLFTLFRHGESLAGLLARRFGERFGAPGIRYIGIAVAALRATANSMFLVGLIDGVSLGIAYALAHVPSPVAWGAVTGILAMFPFLGYCAVAAVCMDLLAHDSAWSAMSIGIAGIAVLFVSDKFVRPTLMAQGARLNFMGALVGTLGGLETFGLLGVFIGPVVIALGEAICEEWLRSDQKT